MKYEINIALFQRNSPTSAFTYMGLVVILQSNPNKTQGYFLCLSEILVSVDDVDK